MDGHDSDGQASTTSASSYAYNVPDHRAPTQRDLRIQAALRNAGVGAGAVAAAAGNNSDDTAHIAEQATKFTRSDLARLVTEDAMKLPRTRQESSQTASKSASDAIFAQLQVIQTLQEEITQQHAKLENLDDEAVSAAFHTGSGGNKEPSATSPGKTAGGGQRSSKPALPKDGLKQSTASKEGSAAHAYDQLAAGFQERAKGVDAIMEKMSRLSQAVKDFHALPPPVLFPDSRVLGSAEMVDTPTMMSPAQSYPPG